MELAENFQKIQNIQKFFLTATQLHTGRPQKYCGRFGKIVSLV